MNYPQSAAKDLAVIRSLMERATLYRAISGPTALFGSLLALAAASFILTASPVFGITLSSWHFVALWLAALAITGAFNAALIYRGARRSQKPFLSPAMRHALRAIAPAMFAGGCLGIGAALLDHNPAYASLIWIFCYGAALCATASFAPKSILRLGLAFIAFGSLCLAAWYSLPALQSMPPINAGALFMAATFGALHLVYALCIGFRESAS
jgi:hypothetical protein